MGNQVAHNIPQLAIAIHIDKNLLHRFCYIDLIDHIVLLRQAIKHPEMSENSHHLDFFIKDYCSRISNNKLANKRQQAKIPWQTEWVWHIHRLHPIHYYNDTIKQTLANRLIDKETRKISINHYRIYDFKDPLTIDETKLFTPTVDLKEAAIRQRAFLEKFQQHPLYSLNLSRIQPKQFQTYVENFIAFLLLASKQHRLVPTVDIDLMWHTSLRFPHSYYRITTALCGYLLNHDDSISPDVLENGYTKTAKLWRLMYGTDYGTTLPRNIVERSGIISEKETNLITTKVGGNNHSVTATMISSSLDSTSIRTNTISSGCGGCLGCSSCDGDGGCGGCGD